MNGPVFASPVNTTLQELVQLQSSAAALARVRRRPSASAPMGASVSRRLGRGLDFAEVREYQPGDDIRLIDWKVTARSGCAHTKLFIEERERPVLLLVDLRSTMHFATRGVFKSALVVRLAGLLGWCALANGDRIGGLVFDDHGHHEVRPRAGRRGLMPLLRVLTEPTSSPSVHGASTPTLAQSLGRLRHVAQAGSTVVLLTDFHGFDDPSRAALGALLHHLDLLAVQVVDPLEYRLPPAGHYAFTDRRRAGEGPVRVSIQAEELATAHRARFEALEAELGGFFRRGRHLLTRVQTNDALLDAAGRILRRERPPLLDGALA